MSELVGKLDNFSDKLSPMVVKEVRQMVRGREFTYSFGLALLAGLVVAFFGLASAVEATGSAGASIFAALMACLAMLGLVIVPLGAFNALRTERSDNTLDLITQTALTPRRIVIGKLLTQGVKLVILFAGLSPFVAMSFLLGGIDLITILIGLSALFLWSLWVCSACLFISCASASRAVSGILFAAMTVGFFILAGQFRFIWGPLLGMGGFYGMGPSGNELWWLLFGSTVFCFISMINFVLLAENRLSLPVEDRSTSLRVGFLVQFFFILACVLGPLWFGYTGYTSTDAVTGLGIFGGVHLALVAIFSTSEEMALSRRIIRTIKGSLRRPLLAIFRPGGGRATAWVLAQMTIFLAVGLTLVPITARDFQWLLGICCYVAFFTGVPPAVGRLILKNQVKSSHLRVAAFVFLPVAMLGADLLQYLFKAEPLRLRGGTYAVFHVLNPFRTLSNWTEIASVGIDWWVFIMGLMGFTSYYLLMRIGQRETKNASILHTSN